MFFSVYSIFIREEFLHLWRHIMKFISMKAILKGIVNEKKEYSQELLKKIDEFGKLSDEVDQAKNEYERLREKYKVLESELQPIIKTLEQLDSRTIQANNYLISIKKMGYDKISYKYSQVLEKVMEMVNADLKKAIDEMLQNSAVITRVATSIGVQNMKKVREGIIDTFSQKFREMKTNLINRLRNNILQMDKFLELLSKISSNKPF